MDFHNVTFHEQSLEEHKRLGKTYAKYDGTTPVISTIDPEIIKTVTAKEFDSFTDVIDFPVITSRLYVVSADFNESPFLAGRSTHNPGCEQG